MNPKKHFGCGTALVTPFRQDSELDEAALRRLVRRQVESGVDFLVPCGTTGESPVLTAEEHLRVVEITLVEVLGRVPVVAGAGGNNTRRIQGQIRELERLGVDALLSVTPYYNKPTQEGLVQHYRALAESTSLPIVLYNVPGRTGCNLEPKTVARLAEVPNIVAVKEASGNVAQVLEILQRVPERFGLLSGDDALTLPLMAAGACGVISVVSNVVPREMTEMVALCLEEDFSAAREIHSRLYPLMQALFLESNPIPVKAALAAIGLLERIYRLPLVPPQPENEAKLAKVLENMGLLTSEETHHVAGGAN
ncbi:MAG: 4-hydroxy-tetrahydrodipicolinate synthase [Acidobacteria bacterium]|nr:4-hydroxy-tetrahydrodipicolinate synthase [Acidobacteriota bacterium]